MLIIKLTRKNATAWTYRAMALRLWCCLSIAKWTVPSHRDTTGQTAQISTRMKYALCERGMSGATVSFLRTAAPTRQHEGAARSQSVDS